MLKVGPGDDGRVCVLRRLEFSSWLITLSYASSGKSLYFPESQPSHFPFVPQFPHLENKDVSPFSWGEGESVTIYPQVMKVPAHTWPGANSK